MTLAQAVYVALCALAIAAALDLQTGRHREAKACVWWAYVALAIGLGWEAVDALAFGPPDFPSSRWIVIGGLAVIQVAAALKDRLGKTGADNA